MRDRGVKRDDVQQKEVVRHVRRQREGGEDIKGMVSVLDVGRKSMHNGLKYAI
jgi:hypothetical protein